MPTSLEQLTFQLYVELDEVTPAVWRRISVSSGARISRLHEGRSCQPMSRERTTPWLLALGAPSMW